MSNHTSESPSTMTQTGFEKLMEELKELRSTGRAEISRQLEEARSFGDLSENAEYAAAKEEQAKLETRISWLEFQLSKAKILDSSSIDTSKVSLGTTVSIQDIINSKSFSYTIVGSEESDPKANKISSSSPVGQALLNKKIGEEVHVKVPRGVRHLRIVNISVLA
ncbi:transcription elongation factor GreA [Aminivibrio sp.]